MKKRGSGNQRFPGLRSLRSETSVKTKFSLVSFSKGKRGMIEVHFNWIFVLIAGAIIFVFFINVVNRQREFSEIKTSGTIITNLESILTGAQISTNTVNFVDMPKVDIGFECNRYFIGAVPKQTKGNVIFSPDLLKGKRLITWALDWSLPYRVTNFLYITDPGLRYIIVDNSENLGQKLYDELPKEMNKDLINESKLGDLIDKNNYKVKFIFLGNVELDNSNTNGLKNLNKMPDEDVTAINITDLGDLNIIPTTGTIEFLQKDGMTWQSKGKTYYLKKESLFGAIFAADLEMYNCVMRKAFRKLNLVSKIYLNRSSELADYYGIDNFDCANAHSKAVSKLKEMVDDSEDRTKDFPDQIDLSYIKIMLDNAKQIGGTLGSANNLAQLRSCVLIY